MTQAAVTDNLSLVRYDGMCRAIDAAFEVDEVKDIRDKAIAIEAYARQARNVEAERRACEIRLRAERKAGQLLREMEKAKGAREPGTKRGTTRLQRETASTLADLGISKVQSHRWQQLADIPEKEFRKALRAPEKPTTSGLLEQAKPPKQNRVPEESLWFWGWLREAERKALWDQDAPALLNGMLDTMKDDVKRLEYIGCHLHIRQVARGILGKRYEPDVEEPEVQHELFPDLQKRYPCAHTVSASEPEYVLLEHLQEGDVRYNVRRLRSEAATKNKHANALEAWWEQWSRPVESQSFPS